MKNDVILKLNNISKKYDDENVFKNVNLEIRKGEVISIIGKSGSGKSTLLKCMNHLENIDTGEIILNGKNINTIPLSELRQKIGLVFQDYNLFEHLTVLENLTIGLLKIKKISKEKSEKMALNILKKIDLMEKKDKYPSELSGGQQQRVAIARTILMKPDIILLDEPTSALDKEMKDSVLELINNLVKEDMTLIVVSHEIEFIEKISDKIFKLTKHQLSEVNIWTQ